MEGDFGHPGKRFIRKSQVCAFIDLVGFTGLDSNDDLYNAYQALGNTIKTSIGKYFWGDMEPPLCHDKATNNLLLLPAGDAYGICFSEAMADQEVLRTIAAIYRRIKRRHKVRVGINKGENIIVLDLNERVNVIGWGINLAHRAQMVAQPNQVVVTEYLIKPHEKTYTLRGLKDLGRRVVKGGTYRFYECDLDRLVKSME